MREYCGVKIFLWARGSGLGDWPRILCDTVGDRCPPNFKTASTIGVSGTKCSCCCVIHKQLLLRAVESPGVLFLARCRPHTGLSRSRDIAPHLPARCSGAKEFVMTD